MNFIKKRLYLLFCLSTTFLLFGKYGLASNKFTPTSYTYILQADKLNKNRTKATTLIRDCDRDLIILDQFYDVKVRWTAKEISTIRSGLPGRQVVAYLSIGEAEAYRKYWKSSWNNPATRPDYILEENPDWKGNFKVKYWKKEWQQIVLNEIDNIINSGFDGVFLDIVDAFEYFENDDGEYIDYKINPDTGNSYRADMIELIRNIREKLDSYHTGDHLIIPQNGSQLLESQLYQQIISLQAIEDLFTDGNKKQPAEHSEYILSFLDSFKNNGKEVLLTEYPSKRKYKDFSIIQAKQHNLILLLTVRELDKIGN